MRLFHGEIPDLVLWAIVAGWVVTQVLTTGGAVYLLRDGAKKRDEVVEHFNEELKSLKKGLDERLGDLTDDSPSRVVIESQLQDLETRLQERLDSLKVEDRMSEVREEVRGLWEDFSGFAESLGKDVEELPKRFAMTQLGEKGMETAALQRYLDSDKDVDAQMTMMEAVALEDPEAIIATTLNRIASIGGSDKWVKENPIKAGLWEAAKAAFLPQVADFMGRQMGTPGAPQLKGKGGTGGVYG